MGFEFDLSDDGTSRPLNKLLRSVHPDENRNMMADPRTRPKTLIMNALIEEGDRGCVLVGCAFIEDATEQLLRTHFKAAHNPQPKWLNGLIEKVFVGNEKQDRLLSSGWSKVTIALLLGLIDRTTQELCDEIRRLRNNCAHFPGDVALNGKAVKYLMKRFKRHEDGWGEMEYHEAQAAKGEGWHWGPKHESGDFSLPRRQFMYVCVAIYGSICWKIQEIAKLPEGQRGLLLGVSITKVRQLPESDPPPPETP